MSCTQVLNGIPASCETNVGGVREVYICNYSDVTGITIGEAEGTAGMVTEITMDTAKKFKKYLFKKNTSNLVSTLNVDPANGINFVQSDLSLVFAKQETAKRIEMSKLALGELRVIVRDANDKYWFLGSEEFVSATAGGAETGTNRTDGNKYTLTLTDYCSTFPPEVDPTIISGLVE